MRGQPESRSIRFGLVIGAVFATASAIGVTLHARQPPTFRAGVDLLAVDVQILDKSGHPVAGLTPADFDVSVAGQKRKVISADFVRNDTAATVDRGASAPPPSPAAPSTIAANPGRTVFVAVDGLSFDMARAREVIAEAQAFVARLSPADRVGLFTYPLGPKLDPTTDHAAVNRALADVTGQAAAQGGQFTLTPSEIVDVPAGDPDAYRRAALRNCGVTLPDNAPIPTRASITRVDCPTTMFAEADSKALQAEVELQTSLEMFGSFLRALASVEGRKIVVLVSAGALASDRTGSRPDPGTLPAELGREAAQADALVYTLFVDHSLIDKNSAENRRGLGGTVNDARDEQLLGRWLDQFSGSAGGVMIRDVIGSGGNGYDQILTETASYYLLGVESTSKDRDGQARELKVKVKRPDLSVRGRAWVATPFARSAAASAVADAAAATRPIVALPPVGSLMALPAAAPSAASPAPATGQTYRTVAVPTRAATVSTSLQRWLDAVNAHAPGRNDASVAEIVMWPRSMVNAALGPIELHRVTVGSGPASLNQLLVRGAILHADIAMLHGTQAGDASASAGTATVIKDGRAIGTTALTFQWDVGRAILDAVTPTPSADPRVRLWYRATAAYLQSINDDAELSPHLFHARQIFPDDAVLLLYSGTMEENYVTPRLPQAESEFRSALAKDPALDEARIRLAHVLGAEGRHADALAELRRVQVDRLPPLLRYYALVIAAREDEAQGNRDRARQEAGEAAALYPAAESARLVLAQIASDGGEQPAALRDLAPLFGPPSTRGGIDPWRRYAAAHVPDADALFAELHRPTP